MGGGYIIMELNFYNILAKKTKREDDQKDGIEGSGIGPEGNNAYNPKTVVVYRTCNNISGWCRWSYQPFCFRTGI